MTDSFAGQTIRGYELQKLLGEGGFGAVYRAYQPLLKRDVAIKVILPKYANEPDFIRRFESEAELIARLEHPFIVPLYDFWRDPTGAYLVMRLVRGGSLREFLEDDERTLSPEEVASILDQIAAALHVSHRENVIHRDIKPDNILLDRDMNAYLSDFGIAKAAGLTEEDDDDTTLTGSLHYIPPEQIQGAGVSPQTDIYALGMVLYELLAGEHPFRGATASQVIMNHLHDPVPDITDINPDYADFDFVIQRATAKDPEERYETTIDMAKDFRSYISGIGGVGTDLDATMEIDFYFPDDIEIPNPYKGLQAFQEADSEKFFGRDALIQQLLTRMIEPDELNRFLAVIGPSGSGKSSVVKAGLMPALRQGVLPNSMNWFIAETTPHSSPFTELADSLLGVAVNHLPNLSQLLREENGIHRAIQLLLPEKAELLLIIDQFEELFTLVEDEAERTRYLENLVSCFTDPESRVRIIVTIRADFYDKPLQYREFGQIFRQRMETVLPLSPEELAESIEKPAQSVNAFYEPGLIDIIIADVGEQPGTLPLLQYALTELFEKRTGYSLHLESYQAIGGVTGALARRANDLFESLDEEGQEAVREMFLRLVNVGDTDITRRRIRRSELPENPRMDHVLNVYGKSRLLTFDRDPQTRESTIEVAHEAIIRNWDNVTEWIEANREILQVQRRLTASATEWQSFSKDPGYFASGVRLIQFESLLESDALLNNLETEYIKLSVDHREKERRREEARKEHELQLQRRAATLLRYIAGIMVIGLVITIGLSIYALGQQGQAEAQAEIAERRSEVSRSLALAANAEQWDDRNQELALALAIEAASVEEPPPYALDVLDHLAYQPGIEYIFDEHGTRVLFTDFSPDGTMVVTTSADTTARVWWVSTGELRYVLRDHTDAVWVATFSPDSRILATGSNDNLIHLWDMSNGELIRTLSGHQGQVRGLAFSPDGTLLLSGSFDNDARLWDVETGEVIHELKGHTDSIFTVAFSPLGDTVLTGSFDDTVRLWDVATGEKIHVFRGHTNDLRDVAYSPDVKLMASASADSTAKIWDLQTGEMIHDLVGHTETAWVMTVAFSRDGTKLATGSSDTTARVWSVATGELQNIYVGHTDRVSRVIFSPAGDRLLTGSWDTTARLWAVQSGEVIHSFEGHTDTIRSVAFSPNGNFFVTASLDGTARLWDVSSPDQLETYSGHAEAILSIDYHPERQLFATGSVDKTIRVWDSTTGQELVRLVGAGELDTWVRSIAFNNDGTQLLSGSEDKVALLWDIESQSVIQIFEGHGGWVTNAEFSPDDRYIVTSSLDNASIDFSVRMWDVETAEVVHIFEGHEKGVLDVEFSPDGTQILSGSEDDTVILWDATNGTMIRQFVGHADDVHAVAFSPDGKTIATASADATIKLWDIETGEEIVTITGHTGDVRSVVFSPDGTQLLTGSEDSTLRLWDVATGQSIHSFAGHSGEVTDAVFMPNANTIASVSWDGTIRVWDTNLPEDLVAWTYANWDIPELPCIQRELYDIQPACDEADAFPTRTPYPTALPQ